MSLNLTPNIENPDGFYEALTDAQRTLSENDANDMNARLVLILANQIGKLDDLKEAIKLASPESIAKGTAASEAPAATDFVSPE